MAKSEFEKALSPGAGEIAVGAAGGAASGAALGATVGSIFPGYGTIIGAGIGATAGGIAGGARARQAGQLSPFEQEELRRLEELQRRREANALGLTEDERVALFNEMEARRQSLAQEQDAARRAALAGAGGAGAAFALGLGVEQQEQRAQAQQSREVAKQNIIERQREEDEYFARLATFQEKVDAKNRRADAARRETGDILADEAERSRTTEGQGLSGVELDAIESQYGLSGGDLSQMLSAMGQNPELLNYLKLVQG